MLSRNLRLCLVDSLTQGTVLMRWNRGAAHTRTAIESTRSLDVFVDCALSLIDQRGDRAQE